MDGKKAPSAPAMTNVKLIKHIPGGGSNGIGLTTGKVLRVAVVLCQAEGGIWPDSRA
jgi:hypothetical protein